MSIVIPPSIISAGKTAGAVGLEILPIAAGGLATIGIFKLFEKKPSKFQQAVGVAKDINEVLGTAKALVEVYGAFTKANAPAVTPEQFKAAVEAEAQRIVTERAAFEKAVAAAVEARMGTTEEMEEAQAADADAAAEEEFIDAREAQVAAEANKAKGAKLTRKVSRQPQVSKKPSVGKTA